jgi:hypothetical protein
MADSTFAEIAPNDDRGAERWRIPAPPRMSHYERSLNSGIPKLAATLGSSGAVRILIRPPAKVEPFVNRVASISSKSKFPA